MSLKGKRVGSRILNTLKSILYYQNRVRHDDARCIIRIPNATVLPCQRHPTMTMKTLIHLHLLADSDNRPKVQSSLIKWNLRGVNWTFYNLEDHQSKVDWIPATHAAGISALIKLTLTSVLPTSVEKVTLRGEVVRETIRKYPYIYYKLPCEWNVQIYSGRAAECCPVVWPLRYPDQIDCWSDLYPNVTFRPAKLVHYDTFVKPDDESFKMNLPAIGSGIEKKMTSECLSDM
ncbi:hypothetical protein FBUS_08075 [Fasciolopsis buskii]|uniref:Uncharacterized protein n=1 Tax=Fasciolopsis buskii TaxID=27845 RepID=A0A8E0RT24_9TREM|nr:hypothetical protein FBUS_08075 [Fasciolopsis buski]